MVMGFLKAVQQGAIVSWGAIQSLPENKDRYLSVLNGVIGDTLDEQDSQLAIDMTLLGEAPANKLCVLIHGLCDSEETWRFSDDPTRTYGSLLQRDYGYAPFYLRYNSGLHISTNGQRLAQLLSELCESSPTPIQELNFIGHSMGGLLVRSACYYGQVANASWVQHVSKIFLLGTPHMGADYEKLGNVTTTVLKAIPNPYTKAIAALANKRSAGIKDLRHGYLLDEDWQGKDPDALLGGHQHTVPLLDGAQYFVIAASLAKESGNVVTEFLGDGVVPSRSVSGIPFPPEHFRKFRGLSHMGLAHDERVYAQIREWCA